jgi:CHAD domain-containing protein
VADAQEETPPVPVMTVGDLVSTSISAQVAAMREHEAGLRAGHDPDHVRKTRVALRRLRSNLRTFAEFVDEDSLAPLIEELAGLAGELGGLRDREVLLARIEAGAKRLPKDEQILAALITGRLEEEIGAARTSLVEFMDSERWGRLLARLEAVATLPPLKADASTPAAEVAGRLAHGPFEKLRKAVRRLPKNPADVELHRIRILAKRSRYAAQAVEPAVGEPAQRFAGAAADLQTILGEHQDAVTSEAWLGSLELAGPPAYVAGRLAGLERAGALEARGKWKEAWTGLDKEELLGWMEKPPAPNS